MYCSKKKIKIKCKHMGCCWDFHPWFGWECVAVRRGETILRNAHWSDFFIFFPEYFWLFPSELCLKESLCMGVSSKLLLDATGTPGSELDSSCSLSDRGGSAASRPPTLCHCQTTNFNLFYVINMKWQVMVDRKGNDVVINLKTLFY